MADGQIASFILTATAARHMKYGMSAHYKHTVCTVTTTNMTKVGNCELYPANVNVVGVYVI
jgi:hypothetical protein